MFDFDVVTGPSDLAKIEHEEARRTPPPGVVPPSQPAEPPPPRVEPS